MDFWAVGAVAAAGYIAKYLQNVSRDKDSLLEKHEAHEAPSCPIRCRLSRRKQLTKDTSTVARVLDMSKLDVASEAKVLASGYVRSLANSDDSNTLSLSSSLVSFSTHENLKENEAGNGSISGAGNSSVRTCTGEMDFSHDTMKKRSSLRTKSGHIIKPLSSLESCLMAQLYNAHSKMEEYMLSAFPSPSTTMRTLLVTDGNQIISRARGNSFSVEIGTDDSMLHKGENVSGIPPLPKVSTLDASYKIKSKIGKRRSERFNISYKSGSGSHFLSQNGPIDQTFLFCLGTSVGIVSSLLSSRREVEKLQGLLKQTENLVQDLQEELEMKDSLTVKELANENCDSQVTCKAPSSLRLVQNGDNSTNYNSKESQYVKTEETSGDMSEIEAELEAELERLGLSINESGLEGRLSNLVELDPDCVADFAQGELRADIVAVRADSDRDACGTSRTPTAIYAVSPHELSLRLHEVIQSRLEKRVQELEVALQNSERRAQVMESERKNVQRRLSSSNLRYSSGEETSVSKEDLGSMAQPLVMNLSGEALDAYNEAYEELMKTNESEEDDSSPVVYEKNYQRSLLPFNQSLLRAQNERAADVSLTRLIHAKEKLYTEDENRNSGDEMEKQLIKQIVEKTRKGSPIVVRHCPIARNVWKKIGKGGSTVHLYPRSYKGYESNNIETTYPFLLLELVLSTFLLTIGSCVATTENCSNGLWV